MGTVAEYLGSLFQSEQPTKASVRIVMPVPYQILNAVWIPKDGEVDLTAILDACDTPEKKDVAARTLDILNKKGIIKQVRDNIYRCTPKGNRFDYMNLLNNQGLLPQKAS